MRAANDGLRFSLELCALAAVAYWGWNEPTRSWVRISTNNYVANVLASSCP